MNRQIQLGQYYCHFKGHLYQVINVAYNAEDHRRMVVYTDGFETWVRDYDEFLSKVDKEKYPDAPQEYRFMTIVELVGRV